MVSTMAAPKLIFSSSEEIKAFRQKHGMNQSQFWGRVGVTQSGGSRYESERNIPRRFSCCCTSPMRPTDRAHRLVEHLRKWKTEPKSGRVSDHRAVVFRLAFLKSQGATGARSPHRPCRASRARSSACA
jgi:hypothetical protein